MSSLKPTLRVDFTPHMTAQLKGMGYSSLKALENAVASDLRRGSFSRTLVFGIEEITVIETGEVLKNFRGVVVAMFERDGVLNVQLAGGDVVELKFKRA